MKVIRICKRAECPELFEVYLSSKRQFCSRACDLADRKEAFEGKKVKEALTCYVCLKKFYVRPCQVRYGAKYCSYVCHQVGEGRKGGATRAEQMKAVSEGKAYVKTKGRHTHRQIMEEKLGRPLVEGEIVHHKDGNKLNNHPDNLEVMTQSDHLREHFDDMMKKRREKHGH